MSVMNFSQHMTPSKKGLDETSFIEQGFLSLALIPWKARTLSYSTYQLIHLQIGQTSSALYNPLIKVG